MNNNYNPSLNNLLEIHKLQIKYYTENYIEDENTLTKRLIDLKDTLIKSKSLKEEFRSLRRRLFENSIIVKEKMFYIYNTFDLIERYYDFDVVQKKEKEKIDIKMFFKNINTNNNSTISKKKLLEEYIFTIFNIKKNLLSDCKLNRCNICNNENMIINKNNDFYICIKCGLIERIMIDTDPLNGIKDSYTKSSVYKRKNHFKEWLNQIQAKESLDIPQNVLDGIINELKVMNIQDLSLINISIIRKVLKKLGYSKYYENSFHIIYIINGKYPISISQEDERKLIKLFKQIEEPFNKFKNEKRKNILRYSYILYKLCELLEIDNILENFSLLKSRSKIAEQDSIWKLICNSLKWEYIPSI